MLSLAQTSASQAKQSSKPAQFFRTALTAIAPSPEQDIEDNLYNGQKQPSLSAKRRLLSLDLSES